MDIDVTVNTQPINVSATVCPAVNINVSTIPSFNIEVGIRGIQGPPGSGCSGSSTGVNFLYNIPSGFDNYLIGFPLSFSSIPFVETTLELPSGSNNLYTFATQNITTTGFNVVFSETIQETGLILNIKCN